MALINLNLINNQIDLLGELVTITVKSSKTYSDWGDESATETDTTSVKVIFNVYGKPSAFQDEGIFQNGDITFFFKSGQASLVQGTKITRSNGDTYEVDDHRGHGIQGNTYVNEVLVKNI